MALAALESKLEDFRYSSGIYSAKLNAVGTTLADQKLLSDP